MSENPHNVENIEEQRKKLQIVDLRNRYLTFYLDEELYGIHISSVAEIIAHMKTTKIPKSPDYMKGVMNLRGNIIPVTDMRSKFGLPEKEIEMQTAIIIVNVQGIAIGFIVDRVEEVLSITEQQLSEPPDFGVKIDTSFIKQMGQPSDRGVVMILDLEVLFTQQELGTMENIN